MSGSGDSTGIGPDDGTPAILAGEYVLGLLPPEEARSVRIDPDMQPLILDWEHKLAPLLFVTPPVAPPATLWHRISFSLGLDERAPQPTSGGATWWHSTTLWRTTSIGLGAVAAVLAVVLVTRTSPEPTPPRFIGALSTSDAQVAFVASVGDDGRLTLQSVHPLPPEAGHDYELWILPTGGKVPQSLGVIKPRQTIVVDRHIGLTTAQVMVSREPVGGSPTGLPTGPVIISGSLSPASG